jgi:glutamine---fructose-6-phosphate transaminase (isomerizing)
MNLVQDKYSRFALVQEMMQTVDIVKHFNQEQTKEIAEKIRSRKKILLTGEGSSRIFPAKNAIRKSLQSGLDIYMVTEGSHQAQQYELADFSVFCASNSGRTKEVILVAQKLRANNNPNRYALTANPDTPLEKECSQTFVLTCGVEKAVAATKSVVEQALFYESIIWNMQIKKEIVQHSRLAEKMATALTMPVDPTIVQAAARAGTIYFAGYNDGVAEELTLKTNEITRKKSDYLEGTYVVHGIEEVMTRDDLVVIIDPIEDEIEKLQQVLLHGVGLTVVAISGKDTAFPTIRVPEGGEMNPYLYLCAGWNLLVEIGLALSIDLDKPQRARKVGNELGCA